MLEMCTNYPSGDSNQTLESMSLELKKNASTDGASGKDEKLPSLEDTQPEIFT